MKIPYRPTGRPSVSGKHFVCLFILLLIFATVQAADSPKVSGVAKERWYIQDVPDDVTPRYPGPYLWDYGLYLDVGLNKNFNNPNNKRWRSKGTTFKINQPQVNLAMGYVSKEVTSQSRWGLEFGLQAGVDIKKLDPEPPPPSNDPVSHADTWRHFYREQI